MTYCLICFSPYFKLYSFKAKHTTCTILLLTWYIKKQQYCSKKYRMATRNTKYATYYMVGIRIPVLCWFWGDKSKNSHKQCSQAGKLVRRDPIEALLQFSCVNKNIRKQYESLFSKIDRFYLDERPY